MNFREYKGQPIYIDGFEPPLTVEKLFGGYVGLPEGQVYDEYSDFVQHVLSKVGDIGPNEPIEGFDVRSGNPLSRTPEAAIEVSEIKSSQTLLSESELNFQRLQAENASLKDMNEKLHRVRAKDAKDNQSFLIAMVALAVLIVAGYFGFGDY